MLQPTSLSLSGKRLFVDYLIQGEESIARQRAQALCIEQTIEFPESLVPDDDIRRQIFGRLEKWQPTPTAWLARISYAIETTGAQLGQWMNVLFGNSSLQPGIRLERIMLPPELPLPFRGPRFGLQGLRKRLALPTRPLLCTALKPMGLSPQRLANQATQFALGGIDIIKDDHGLADPPFCRFQERVQYCANAVHEANAQTQRNALYAPNLPGPIERIFDQAHWAKKVGAGALLLSPGLLGWDTMRALSEDDELGLPILCHPAFLGSFLTHPTQGISHFALLGQWTRLAGADASIFPNYGGRFSFSQADCQRIAEGTQTPMGSISPNFPAPGGGMTLERISEIYECYGNQVMYLIGGALHQGSQGLLDTTRSFVEQVENLSPPPT